MDSGQLAWTIIVIIVLLVVIGAVIFFGRRWKKTKDHERADNLRQSAAADELGARESEAKAARAAADAQQADVDAAHLRDEAHQRQADAESVRSRSEEQARKAEALDPLVDDSEPPQPDPSGREAEEAADIRPRHAVDGGADGKDTRGDERTGI
ncbi:hypothetical protein ACQCSX_05680 [Pseudarthrobacter sp. P1]|uniref:hypothetical protein n=1 Tax=Pseudarthrobacter sp. P1 TaxID=3418418 RepID=UPI003CEDC713